MTISEMKERILRLYPRVHRHDLDGMTVEAGGYITGDRRWVYFVRHGGFIERFKFRDDQCVFSVEAHDELMRGL